MGSSQRRLELFSSGGIAGVKRGETDTEGDSCRIVCEGSDASEKRLGRQAGLFPKTRDSDRKSRHSWGGEEGGGPVCAVCECGLVCRDRDLRFRHTSRWKYLCGFWCVEGEPKPDME